MTSREIKPRRFWKYLTRVHKWAGLILGLQIAIWFASGFFMSLFPINDVRGRHLAEQTEWPLTETTLIPIDQATALYVGTVSEIKLQAFVDKTAYVLHGDNGTQKLNAISGTPWEPVDESAVRKAARTYYKGVGTLQNLTKISEPTPVPIEYRRALPVWQVQLDDRSRTRLYIDAETGQLNAVRTRLWRVFDFMWMLHIMDYQSRDNINLWWLRLASGLALLFALTGLGLVVHRIFLHPKARKRSG